MDKRQREEISNQISELDKEVFRLNSQREKLNDAREYRTNYMWPVSYTHLDVYKRQAEFLGMDLKNSKIIVAHLGNGASISAVLNGECVDTVSYTHLDNIFLQSVAAYEA